MLPADVQGQIIRIGTAETAQFTVEKGFPCSYRQFFGSQVAFFDLPAHRKIIMKAENIHLTDRIFHVAHIGMADGNRIHIIQPSDLIAASAQEFIYLFPAGFPFLSFRFQNIVVAGGFIHYIPT